MPSHPLTSFEIQKYYQYDSRFNWVYYRDDRSKTKLKKKKNGAYVINPN